MRDKHFAKFAVAHVGEYSFSNKHFVWVWQRISHCVVTHDEIPATGIYSDEARGAFPDAEEQAAVLGLLLALDDRKPEDMSPRSSIERVVLFNTHAAIRTGAIPMLEALNRNDIAEAQRVLEETRDKVHSAQNLSQPLLSMAATLDADLAAYGQPGNAPVWKLPLPTLNRLIAGGLPGAHLVVVMGSTNSGKSAFLAAIAWEALASSPESLVLSFPVEEGITEYRARFHARAAQIDRSRLRGALSDLERGAVKTRCLAQAALLERLIVQQPASSNIGSVISAARQVRSENPGRPILLVVDSPDDLQPTRKAESYRLERARVFTELDMLAKEEAMQPFSVAVTTQANRAAAGKKRVGAQHTSETKVSADKAALGLALLDSDAPCSEEDPWKVTNIQVWKNRLGSVNDFQIPAEGHFGMCMFREAIGGAGAGE